MNKLVYTATLILSLSASTFSSPLQKERVSAEAKWLLHWDLDNFRKTQVGSFFTTEVIEKRLAEPKAELKRIFNLEVDWNEVHSLTAYGTDYGPKPDASGVLIIQTSMKPRELLETVLRKETASSSEPNGPLKKLQSEPYPLYSIHHDLLLAPHSNNLLLVSKSPQAIAQAREVLAGKTANLGASTFFDGYPAVPNTFFFLGVAEGFGQQAHLGHPLATENDGAQGKNQDGLPPQAKILRMADGGRVVLGEVPDHLFLDLALKAKTDEASQQMQQVIQGLIALFALSQTENPDVQPLIQSAQVSAKEKLVTLGLEYPVSMAVKKITEAIQREQDRPHAVHQPKPKAESDAPAK